MPTLAGRLVVLLHDAPAIGVTKMADLFGKQDRREADVRSLIKMAPLEQMGPLRISQTLFNRSNIPEDGRVPPDPPASKPVL